MMKKLDEIKKTNPFKVPENYFDEVSRSIISSMPQEMPRIRKKGLLARMNPYLAMAASIALLIALSYTGFRFLNSGRRSPDIAQISIEELSDAYLYEFDIRAFEEKISDSISGMDLPQMSKSEIIDCLISENIELNEIYENL